MPSNNVIMELFVKSFNLWSRYGKDAGHATNDAVNSAINVGVTAFNIDHLGVKAIVKKTAKETSHAILDEYKLIEKPNKKKEPH